MQSSSTNIAVTVRIRPLLASELHSGHKVEKLIVDDEKKEVLLFNEKYRQYKAFKFDKVFGMNAPQQNIYSDSEVSSLLQKVVEGYHATIFAYGQTGSGKTYSMEGYRYEMMDEKSAKPYLDVREALQQGDQNKGIIPRAVEQLFSQIKDAGIQNKRKYQVSKQNNSQVYCSYLQIYQEKIYDLLNNFQYSTKGFQTQHLKLRWNKQDDFIVENLFTFQCKSASEVMELFHIGIRNKVLASHRLNNASSRSHTILTITVESFDPNNPHSIINSKLHLVDLAGSERTGQTGAQGRVQKESIDINKSLFTLRSVIVSLAERSSEFPVTTKTNTAYVPYRDSKLTSILRQSLGGNSYCLMIACIAPSDDFFQENIKSANEYIQFLCTLTGQQVKIFGDEKIKKKNSMPLPQPTPLSLTSGPYSKQFQFRRGNTTISPKEEIRSAVAGMSGVLDVLPSPLNRSLHPIGTDRPETSTSINIFMPNGTQSNFMTNSTFVTQKSKGLQTMAKSIANQPNFITERLIESVQMVKEVLQSNIVLRENIANLTGEVDRLTSQLFELQCENDDVRDRLQIMECIAGRTAPSLYDSDTRSKQDIANELLRCKKEKRALELRLRHMELDKIKQQQQQVKQYQSTTLNMMPCPSDQKLQEEPVRPAMHHNIDDLQRRMSRPMARVTSQKSKPRLNRNQQSSAKRESQFNSTQEFQQSLNNPRINPKSTLNIQESYAPRDTLQFPRKQVADAFDRFQNTFGHNALDPKGKQFRRTTGVFSVERNNKLINRRALPELQRQPQSEAYVMADSKLSEREAIIEQMNRSFTQMENQEIPNSYHHAPVRDQHPLSLTQQINYPGSSGTPQPRDKAHSVKASKIPPNLRFSNQDRNFSVQNQSTRSSYQRMQTSIPAATYAGDFDSVDFLAGNGKNIKRKLKTSNLTHKSLPNSIQEELDKPITPPSLPIIEEQHH